MPSHAPAARFGEPVVGFVPFWAGGRGAQWGVGLRERASGGSLRSWTHDNNTKPRPPQLDRTAVGAAVASRRDPVPGPVGGGRATRGQRQVEANVGHNALRSQGNNANNDTAS